ncbi:phosphoribosylglycinamide formyltransferase, partial [Candidatus Poribacteria bacterium]|nr:phosphoribosylglycinamide formyltransferase [Candidatus Poribacteria bacterium]
MKIAVLASGSGTNLQNLIVQLHNDKNCHIEIAVVISDRKNAYALQRAKH